MAEKIDVQKLAKRAVLVDLTIRMWNGKRTSKEATQMVVDRVGGGRPGTFTKFILPPDYMKPIVGGAARLYKEHKILTSPFDDTGWRIMNVNNLFRYKEKMQKVADESFLTAVDEMFSDWDRVVSNARSQLGSLFNSQDYDDPSNARKLFSVETRYNPVPMKEHFLLDFAQEGMNEIREQFVQDTEENIRNAISDPVHKMQVALKRLAERLNGYGDTCKRLHGSVLGSVTTLAEMLPDLMLEKDDRVLEALSGVTSELELVDVEDLRSTPALRREVANKSNEALKKLEELYGIAEEEGGE